MTRPKINGKRIGVTVVKAAEIVLQASFKPLHSLEIVEQAFTLGLIELRGKSPDHSVQAAIWRDLHGKRKNQSPFVMIGDGRIQRRYWLKSKLK